MGNPRDLWPRERDFCRWLAASPALLAGCLGLPGLEVTGREVVTGDQVAGSDRLGRLRWDGGLRADLTARDARGRSVVIEAQFGPADHDHLGKLVAYATALRADVAVWVVAAAEPPFLAEHLDALADLSQAFAGRRQFTAVTVTLESAPSPVPLPPGEALLPRVRRAPDWPSGPPGEAPAVLCNGHSGAGVRAGRRGGGRGELGRVAGDVVVRAGERVAEAARELPRVRCRQDPSRADGPEYGPEPP